METNGTSGAPTERNACEVKVYSYTLWRVLLNDLSLKHKYLFLLNDLNELMKETIIDYLIMFDCKKEFEIQLREILRQLSIMFEWVYKEESDVLKNKDDKDCWLLTALCRSAIAKKAFNDYIEHTH